MVLEINSRKNTTRASREEDLAESLAFTRLHLAAALQRSFATDSGGTTNVL